MRTKLLISPARKFLPGNSNNTTSTHFNMTTVLLKLKKHGFAFLATQVFLISLAFGQTVTTDKLDYYPGDYVIITGSGWQPGEIVKLHLYEIFVIIYFTFCISSII